MTIPFNHQAEVFERFKDEEYGALLLEPGLGKTKIAIDIIEHKYKAGEITAALVVTTKGLLLNWADVEIPKHSSDNVSPHAHVWGRNKGVPESPEWLWYFLINIDALRTDAFKPFMREFLKLHPRFALFVDESTVAKNGKAARTKVLLQVARRAACRFIMTGTPVTQSPLDVWSQTEILSPGLLGYSNYYAFKWDHTITQTQFFGNRNFQKIVGYKNIEPLIATLKTFSAMVKARDCLDLPPRRYRRIPVEMTKEQQTAYDDLKQKALTWLQGHQITAVNAVSLINRLLQICAGQLKINDQEYVSIPNKRLGVLKDLVNESNKVIVWTSFVRTAEEIMTTLNTLTAEERRELGYDYKKAVHLESGLSIAKRQAVIEQFKTTDVKALVANPASSGHGITLIEANSVIYYSNSWSLEHRVQSEFRTDRIGQTQSVLYTDLYVPGTAEEYVLDLLTDKRGMAERFMGAVLDDPARVVREVLS